MKRSFKNILTMVMIATMVLGNSFLVSAHETICILLTQF